MTETKTSKTEASEELLVLACFTPLFELGLGYDFKSRVSEDILAEDSLSKDISLENLVGTSDCSYKLSQKN